MMEETEFMRNGSFMFNKITCFDLSIDDLLIFPQNEFLYSQRLKNQS